MEAERTSDVYKTRVDGYESDSETDFGSEDGQDFWDFKGKHSIRHHKKQRQCLYTPCAEM